MSGNEPSEKSAKTEPLKWWYTETVAEPKKQESLELLAEASNLVPSFASKVGIAKTDSGNVILTFAFDLPGERATLIKRIVIESKTMDEVMKLIKELPESKDDK